MITINNYYETKKYYYTVLQGVVSATSGDGNFEEIERFINQKGATKFFNKIKKILVFFWKDNQPVATAEVFYDGRIGQFYGDERDRTKCEATPELKNILNIWLSKAKLKKRKVSKKNHILQRLL